MDILFINANQERMPDPVPPIGVSYIAAAARLDGHHCQLFDLNFHKSFEDELKKSLREKAPQLIGLSIRNVDNVAFPKVISYLKHYQAIVACCREVCPEIPIVVGGSAFSLFPDEFFKKLDVDYGIVGEGEDLFRQLANSLEKEGRPPPNLNPGPWGLAEIFYSLGSPVDFDSLTPARDLLDVAGYFQQGGSINIQTKRGCYFKCSYCTYPLLEGTRIRKRSAVSVVDEMENCLQTYNVDYFFFVDNVFNLPNAHAIEICEEIIRRGLQVRWTAYVSPAMATEELFATFKAAGCSSVDFGTDAASELGLNAMDKSFTVEDIRNCSRWCHEQGIKFNHSLILGVPGETRETIEQTIEIINACRPTAVIALMGIRLYRGTPLTRRLVAEGWVSEDQIGVQPVFYVEESVRDYLVQRLGALADTHRNWIVPGLKKKMNERYFRRLRSRGVKGPLWEVFDSAPSPAGA